MRLFKPLRTFLSLSVVSTLRTSQLPVVLISKSVSIEELDIPVFHDDQHGTAVVVLAALLNALKIVDKKIGDLKVVVNGIGAAGVACTKIVQAAGVQNIVGCDTEGALFKGRTENMNWVKDWFARNTNPDCEKGLLKDVIKGADVFFGLSVSRRYRRQ